MEYVPNAYINLCVDKNQQRANNQLIYDFKAGKAATTRFCAELLISYLRRQYGRLLEDFVVVLHPAAHNGSITRDSAISQLSLTRQASRPQTSTFASMASASLSTMAEAIT